MGQVSSGMVPILGFSSKTSVAVAVVHFGIRTREILRMCAALAHFQQGSGGCNQEDASLKLLVIMPWHLDTGIAYHSDFSMGMHLVLVSLPIFLSALLLFLSFYPDLNCKQIKKFVFSFLPHIFGRGGCLKWKDWTNSVSCTIGSKTSSLVEYGWKMTLLCTVIQFLIKPNFKVDSANLISMYICCLHTPLSKLYGLTHGSSYPYDMWEALPAPFVCISVDFQLNHLWLYQFDEFCGHSIIELPVGCTLELVL